MNNTTALGLILVVSACRTGSHDPANAPPLAAPAPPDTVATTAASSAAPVPPVAPVAPTKVRPTAAEVRSAYAEIFANPFDRAAKFDQFVARVGTPDETQGKHDSDEGGKWIWYSLDEQGDCRELAVVFGSVGDVSLNEVGSISGAFAPKCR